ncbi:MAG TPA: hypothetical protein VE621_14005 [Bryobacteraceae bacterium]|nr:hypothetical protein [Bryobacteraceae bacterium]
MCSRVHSVRDGRLSYQATFASVVPALRYVLEPTTDHSVVLLFLIYLLLFWPFMLYIRILDVGLPGWLLIPIYLITMLIALSPTGLIFKLLSIAAVHSPFLFIKSGAFGFLTKSKK